MLYKIKQTVGFSRKNEKKNCRDGEDDKAILIQVTPQCKLRLEKPAIAQLAYTHVSVSSVHWSFERINIFQQALERSR
jgi:hypothetical protein